MRKRGKYGLTNTIYTSKIGGFLPYIVLDGEALLLMPKPGCLPGAAAGAAWFQANSQTPQVSMTQVVGPWGWVSPGARGVPVKNLDSSLNSYPQEKERKDWNGLHLMI